jgi:acyl-CoA dehydrogenase
MGSLGGALKRKEKLSARLGDILSLLYLCSATLKRYERKAAQADDAPLMHWAIWDAMFKAQNAFEGVISNFPESADRALMRRIVFPLGRPYVVPSDALGHAVAHLLIAPSATRDRLTAAMYIGQATTIRSASSSARWRQPWRPSQSSASSRRRSHAHRRPSGAGCRVEVLASARRGRRHRLRSEALVAQRELCEQVIRVDDFDRDLGASLLLRRSRRCTAIAVARSWAPAEARLPAGVVCE